MGHVLAHDAGVLWTKATDGSVEYVQPSLVGGIENLLVEPSEEYVAVNISGESEFVGFSAMEQSRFKRWLRQNDKVTSAEYRTMLLGAAGSILGPGQHQVRYVGGLPIGHWAQKEDLRRVLNQLSGVVFSVSSGTRKYTASLHIDDCLIVPQPYGSLADAVLDDSGQAISCCIATDRGAKELRDSRVMVVEIGSHTCHMLVIDRMSPLVAEAKTLPYGIAAAYEAIGAALNGIPAWEVDRRLRQGSLITDGVAFKQLAAAITAEVRGTNSDVDVYFVSGGGGQQLYPYLLNRERKVLHTRPFTGNLWGFYKLGVRKWRKTAGGLRT